MYDRQREFRFAWKCPLWFCFAGLVGLLVWTGAAYAAPDSARQQVVYHISDGDPDRQRSALRNVANHLNILGDDGADIVVVLRGDGVTLLLRPDAQPQLPGGLSANATGEVRIGIEDLRLRGVRFEVCAHSLARRGIDDDRYLLDVDPADLVPSGIDELVRLQRAGYTYIKP